MTTFVILQLIFIAIFSGGLTWKRRHLGWQAAGSLSLTLLGLAILFLVAQMSDFPARKEIIAWLSFIWGWFGWCWFVIVMLFCETLFGPGPWKWESVKQKAQRNQEVDPVK